MRPKRTLMGRQDQQGPRFRSLSSQNCQEPLKPAPSQRAGVADLRPERSRPLQVFVNKASVLLLKLRCFMTQLNTGS